MILLFIGVWENDTHNTAFRQAFSLSCFHTILTGAQKSRMIKIEMVSGLGLIEVRPSSGRNVCVGDKGSPSPEALKVK